MHLSRPSAAEDRVSAHSFLVLSGIGGKTSDWFTSGPGSEEELPEAAAYLVLLSGLSFLHKPGNKVDPWQS